MKKDNARNIRCLAKELFVPSTQRASILYWRLSDLISIISLGGKSMESNLKNLDWSFPQALKSMSDQEFNEYDVHTKKASITFLGRNITSTLGIQLFKVRNIWVFSSLFTSKPEKFCLVCIFFEESVFTFQFLNDKISNYVSFWNSRMKFLK